MGRLLVHWDAKGPILSNCHHLNSGMGFPNRFPNRFPTRFPNRFPKGWKGFPTAFPNPSIPCPDTSQSAARPQSTSPSPGTQRCGCQSSMVIRNAKRSGSEVGVPVALQSPVMFIVRVYTKTNFNHELYQQSLNRLTNNNNLSQTKPEEPHKKKSIKDQGLDGALDYWWLVNNRDWPPMDSNEQLDGAPGRWNIWLPGMRSSTARSLATTTKTRR